MSDVLRGYSVGVTADRQSEEQLLLLRGRGAECVHGPSIRTQVLGELEATNAATDNMLGAKPAAAIILTGLGLRAWFDAAAARSVDHELQAALAGARIFVRGSHAHAAVMALDLDLDVEWIAADATSADVAERMQASLSAGADIVVLNDGAPGEPMVDELRAAGFDATGVSAYRTLIPADRGPAEALIRATVERRVDAVTFTSPLAVDNLVSIARDVDLGAPLAVAFRDDVVPVCIGPVTTHRAASAGFGEAVQPARSRLGSMVQQLTDVLAARTRQFDLASQPVQLRGRLIQVDGRQTAMLSARERSLLVALIERPGSVRSKQELLDRVWAGSDSGTHVVEVTIGRLRKRLGPAGLGIETVMRRGYRASAI